MVKNTNISVENKARIDNLEKSMERLEKEIILFSKETRDNLTQLTNHFSKRPPVWAVWSLTACGTIIGVLGTIIASLLQ